MRCRWASGKSCPSCWRLATLDPIARRQFLEQLVAISADERRAIVFSSHIVSDIERLANRIWILKEGRLDWQEDLDSLKESIVRVHVRSTGGELPQLEIPGALALRRQGTTLTVVVRGWNAGAQAALEQSGSVRVEIEPLSLEEIFLELHR